MSRMGTHLDKRLGSWAKFTNTCLSPLGYSGYVLDMTLPFARGEFVGTLRPAPSTSKYLQIVVHARRFWTRG